MKIVHISDIHIRMLKYHDEYRQVFWNLYQELERIKPDLVINTGDTVHSKTQVTNELFDLTAEFISEIAARCKTHIILPGNHDFNLMNLERLDAISPIVESLDLPNVIYAKKSGRVEFAHVDPVTAADFDIWAFSLMDREHYPESFPSPGKTKIGLFHGAVEGCVTDLDWEMTDVERKLSMFDGLDYVLLGDIHKQQFFGKGNIGYAGSLIQQNFGEEIDKGFLLWDIKGPADFSVSSTFLEGSRKFFTLPLEDDLSFFDYPVPKGTRLRIMPPRQLTLTEQRDIEKRARRLFSPYDVLTLSPDKITSKNPTSAQTTREDFLDLKVQEKLLREHLAESKVDSVIIDKVIELNKELHNKISQKDRPGEIKWELKRIEWSNLFNYGEGNVIDFTKMKGLTGLFAPNGSGKTNLLDTILLSCFDGTTTGVNKNIFFLNDNKESGSARVIFGAGNSEYQIERKIDRVKYGQRKFSEAKEWGKTVVDFDQTKPEQKSLNGDLRPETEQNIRQVIGSMEDCLMVSFISQINPLDLTTSKETKRKEILYRFLGLDGAEEKVEIAKRELKILSERREEMDKKDELEKQSVQLEVDLAQSVANYQEKLAVSKQLNEMIERDRENIARMREAAAGLDANQHRSVKQITEDMAAAQSRHQTLLSESISQSGIKVTREDLDNIREEIKQNHSLVNEAMLKKGEAKAALDAARREIEQVQQEIETLGTVPCGDKYPGCRFLVKAFSSREKLPDLELKAKRFHLELIGADAIAAGYQEKDKKLNEKLERCNFYFDNDVKFDAHQAQVKVEEQDIQRLQDELQQAQKSYIEKEKVKVVQETLRSLQSALDEEKKQQDALDEEVRNLDREIGGKQVLLDRVKSLLTDFTSLQQSCSVYEHFIQAMGKDGVPLKVLVQKLPQINETVNKILSGVAEFNVSVDYDPDDCSVRFFVQYGSYKSRLLELEGGAAKFLASLALRAAFHQISSVPKSNFLIVDEGFGKLDPKNMEAVQRMFDYLKTVFDHVLVVSHIDVMKDYVDGMIDITNDAEGYAHVEAK